MEILPSIEQVREIARTGKYDVLPVSCEILSDRCTPMEALRILKNVSTHCYLLEKTLPDCLRITADTLDGEVMAVCHTKYPIYGVQFHPESILTPNGKDILKNFIKGL